MALKIKFPIIMTEPQNNGFVNQSDMINSAKNIFERYNNSGKNITLSTRGKTKQKTIKSVETSTMSFGQDKCLLLRIEEYKEGYGDLYYENKTQTRVNISHTDKLGSTSNYAMMYPYISYENNGNSINQWVVFIYDTPDKDDFDIINTVKMVISKILQLKFQNVLKGNIAKTDSYPWVSVLYTSIENIENRELQCQQYIVQAKEKKQKEVWYQDIPITEADELRTEQTENKMKKIIKYFTTSDKKSYIKYEYEYDEQGRIASTFMHHFSYSLDFENVNEMYQYNFIEQSFGGILQKFLSNE